MAELEARLGAPPRTPDNSSLPPSAGQKPGRAEKQAWPGPRTGSLGRKSGGLALCATPDKVVVARPVRCAQCEAALGEAERVLAGRYDKVELPPVRPVVTRVERYAGRCRCCGGLTLAPVPEGLEPGGLFGPDVVALALYLRVVHAVSYKRLSRLLLDLFGLAVSEGALDAAFRRAKPRFDADVARILARLRRARVVCSDETSVRVGGRTCWNWVFQNADVVVHVIRPSRGAGVVAAVLDGHRPAIWVCQKHGALPLEHRHVAAVAAPPLDRDQDAPALRHLVQQDGRHVPGRGRDDRAVVGCAGSMPARAVAGDDGNMVQRQDFQVGAALGGKGREQLDPGHAALPFSCCASSA